MGNKVKVQIFPRRLWRDKKKQRIYYDGECAIVESEQAEFIVKAQLGKIIKDEPEIKKPIEDIKPVGEQPKVIPKAVEIQPKRKRGRPKTL